MRQKKQDGWEEKPLNRAMYEEGAEPSPWVTGNEVWRRGMDVSDAYRCQRLGVRMTLRCKGVDQTGPSTSRYGSLKGKKSLGIAKS